MPDFFITCKQNSERGKNRKDRKKQSKQTWINIQSCLAFNTEHNINITSRSRQNESINFLFVWWLQCCASVAWLPSLLPNLLTIHKNRWLGFLLCLTITTHWSKIEKSSMLRPHHNVHHRYFEGPKVQSKATKQKKRIDPGRGCDFVHPRLDCLWDIIDFFWEITSGSTMFHCFVVLMLGLLAYLFCIVSVEWEGKIRTNEVKERMEASRIRK